MSGFKHKNINNQFREGLYNVIIISLIKSCECMNDECSSEEIKLPNHEEKLRNHLLENYLENQEKRSLIGLSGVAIRFIPEVLENYDADKTKYIGRTDIKVVSNNWLISNNKDYYIIECKRIDGGKPLNEKYVDEGICRFVDTSPKYSSFHNKNIMLGFVVKKIDCKTNVSEIADLHKEKLEDIIQENITIMQFSSKKDYCVCESSYISGITLNHIFYDFSRIIS